MKQEIERFGFGGFNLGAIFNEGTDLNLRTVWMSDGQRMVLGSRMKASKYGYMGPELKAMFQVRTIVCSRYLRNVALLCASDGNKFYKIDFRSRLIESLPSIYFCRFSFNSCMFGHRCVEYG